ncbi:hypothetical protein CU254_33680 [Amycolatopsis sp. AA4]|uniref:hypothetical protein n=1 Tax=Actinomycetes TaxID=1760 RepID=UPI0001B58129|nr:MULTISPECIES: hypothetical protein [Actinomycetes]ATY14813.1 hypothetical protein CU254_33680 [Amycolatopsis sp. AA4]EFL10963.1 hypothetical protein SSMG_06634 [Streptomyces sp. AA4]
MRWTVLYARSRHLAMSLAATLLCAAVLPPLLGENWSNFFATVSLGAAVAVAGVGLSGQDIDLDRTASFRWPPRRLAHLLLIGVVAGGVMLAAQGFVDLPMDPGWILRDAAGFLGLTGLAATLFGGQFGWTLPLGWAMTAVFVPRTTGQIHDLVAWPMATADSTAAGWAAGLLFLAGTAAYTVAGARR